MVYNKWLVKKDISRLRNFVETNQYPSAQKLADKMLKINRKNIEVLFEQSKIRESQKQWYLALYALEEIIKINDYPAPSEDTKEPLTETLVRANKIKIYEVLKKGSAIAQECEKILDLDPNNKMAKFFVGKRLFELKNYKLAKQHLQATDDETFEKHREVLGMLVDIHLAEKKYTEAQSILDKLFEVWDKPICRVYHQKAAVLFYLKEYKESLEVMYKIDKIYKWPLDLKLIEMISLYESYISGDSLPEEVSEDISNELRWRNIEKEMVNKFEPLLSKHIDEETDLVNHARYAYSILLVKAGDWNSAVIQMTFIKRSHAYYLNNDDRLAFYEKIKHDDILSRFFQQKFNSKNEEKSLKLGVLIEKIVLNDNKWVCDSVEVSTRKKPLDPVVNLFHFMQEEKKANLYVVFSVEQNLSVDVLVHLLKSVKLTEGVVNDLTILSPFSLESMIVQTKGFDDIKLYHGTDLLKVLLSFSNQVEEFMANV